jgi:hypothetical protein
MILKFQSILIDNIFQWDSDHPKPFRILKVTFA